MVTNAKQDVDIRNRSVNRIRGESESLVAALKTGLVYRYKTPTFTPMLFML